MEKSSIAHSRTKHKFSSYKHEENVSYQNENLVPPYFKYQWPAEGVLSGGGGL